MPKGRDWWTSRIAIAIGIAEVEPERALHYMEELQEASREVGANDATPPIREAQMSLYWAISAMHESNPHKAKSILRAKTIEALYDL
jgi:hypothetical protein